MSIVLLEWDTKFFKKRIGRLNLGSESILNYLNEINEFDIVYVFSDYEILINAPLIDIKVTYNKRAQNRSLVCEIIQFDFNKHDYYQLLELAYLSGHDSRFLRDSYFGISEFKRLYKQWIDNSINDKDTLVLIHFDGVNIGGFVTVKKNYNFAQIGLIAVDSDSQGKGIGRKLINAVESNLDEGIMLLVATQESNRLACKFYESNGFIIKKKEYLYHYKHDSI